MLPSNFASGCNSLTGATSSPDGLLFTNYYDQGMGITYSTTTGIQSNLIDLTDPVLNQAVELGCSDVAAIRYLLEEERREPRERREALDIGRLVCYERPQPSVADYDRLLASVTREVIQ